MNPLIPFTIHPETGSEDDLCDVKCSSHHLGSNIIKDVLSGGRNEIIEFLLTRRKSHHWGNKVLLSASFLVTLF